MQQRITKAIISLALLPVFAAAHAQKVSSWLTTPDGASLLTKQKPAHFTSAPATADVIDVDDTQRFQTIDGFGYALTGGSAQLLMRMSPGKRAALLNEIFTTKANGIGVSYLRLSIGASDLNDHVFTYDDMPPGETDPTLAKFSLNEDRLDLVPLLREILTISPGIKILASPWTAPSWMKTSDTPKGGHLQPQFYPVYADYLVRYLLGMRKHGIPIDAVTVQNEPENPHNTPSMLMDATEEGTFIRDDLGPALQKAGLPTKIILFDHNGDHPDYPIAILNDPAAAKYVDGTGFHLYLGTTEALTRVHDAAPAKNLYFTEQMVINARGGTATTAIADPVSRIIIGATRNWSRNVLLWNLAADPKNEPHTSNGGCSICQGALTIDGDTATRNRAWYTLATASKFVPPGSTRIASTATAILPNAAFKTPQGKTVLIVANNGATPETFTIRTHNRTLTTSLSAGAITTLIW